MSSLTPNWEQPGQVPPGFHVPQWQTPLAMPIGTPCRSPLQRMGVSYKEECTSPNHSLDSTTSNQGSFRLPPRSHVDQRAFMPLSTKQSFAETSMDCKTVHPMKRGFFLSVKKKIAIKLLKMIMDQLNTIIALLDE